MRAIFEDGIQCEIKWQVTKGIRRPLLAVSSITKNGRYVYFEEEQGWIVDKKTGAFTRFGMKNGVYVINLKVQVFPRQ